MRSVVRRSWKRHSKCSERSETKEASPPRFPTWEPECPVEAIKPDTEPGLEKLLKLNADFAKIWPNITAKKEPPADAKAWEDVPNKLDAHFSPNPGTGD